VEGRVTGEFAKVLEAQRGRFNAKFAHARRFIRHLDGKDFLDHLADVVEPIAAKAEKAPGARIDEIIDDLFDLSLELFSIGGLGKNKRYPLVEKAWRELLPKIPHLIAEAPRKLVAAISNAICNLSTEKNADELRWLNLMQAIAPMFGEVEVFLKTGAVAAWRFGMAHYRDGALASCENIPLPILSKIFGFKNEMKDSDLLSALQRIQNDRWYDPSIEPEKEKSGLTIVKKTGGFKGFGGLFVSPPRVMVSDGRFFLFDAEHNWMLHADVFGTTFLRAGKGPPPGSASSSPVFRIDKHGKVMRRKAIRHFPVLARADSWASTEDTLVVCLPFSHYVYLIAEKTERGYV